jgi:hypothetical protein
MRIVRFFSTRRMSLVLGLFGALALAGCDSGGGGGTDAAVAEVKDGAHGKAQLEARQKQFGATANPPAGKVAAPPKTPAPEAKDKDKP